MEPIETSESLRDTVSETETNNWEVGVLEYRRQLLQTPRGEPIDTSLDPDFAYGIFPPEGNTSRRKAELETNDGVIVLGGNKMVKLDCFEFAQISAYFRAAFFGNFEEAKTKFLIFGDPEPDRFLNCLAFARRLVVDEKDAASNISIDLDKALELLDVAAYLLIEPVLEIISNIIVKTVTASKLLAVYHKAENRYPPLARRLWNLIVREFDKLILNDTFFELTEEELVKLLQEKHLNIRRCDETSMVRSWIEANRWNGNSVEHLQQVLTNARDDMGFYDGGTRLPNSVLIASGGWSNVGPTIVVETLDAPAQQWVRSEVKLFETPRAYHAVVNTGEDLYTIGGFNGAEYYRSTRKFNLKTRQLVEVAPMYDQRCYVACGLLDEDRIVALGGYDNHDRLKTAEILHISTNQWKRIAEMSVKRSDGHCVIHEGKIYAVGGFDGVNCHATIETYDAEGDRWLTMKQVMRSRRSGVRAVVIEGAICVSNFGIETLNNQIVVAGGYAGVVGTISDVEAFDFRADTWLEMPAMGMRRSAVYLTRIDNHEIIEKLVRPDITPDPIVP
ncbi:unnamed protein product [Toxocara canis]|uniref:BACK domain-containing protein n=1 Tax=Toxocara canis TaxID=6265 RepID=A0A183ULI4_TOXCA|nr:unnamed protein product [Toxocara canis]